jgi:tRNA-5-methyluridine54 2-sulfurtransferase
MRCIKCAEKAVIELPRHSSAFCKPHFLEYFTNQVKRAVRRNEMFTHQDRILVAVSGGKDSLTLWHVLSRMGYLTAGLHIHLGIGAYSDASYEKTARFALHHGLDLVTVNLHERYGLGVPEVSKKLRRVPCSACGLSKRYILNREAFERGFTVIATGHNLDDEAATLLGNILHWQIEPLTRQSPVLASNGKRLVKRVKPLYTITERESAAYALLCGIDFIEEECPNAHRAKSLLYKDVLDRIEVGSPGTKQRFLTDFFDKAKGHLRHGVDAVALRECAMCGDTTTAEICAFCRLWQQAREITSKGRTTERNRI